MRPGEFHVVTQHGTQRIAEVTVNVHASLSKPQGSFPAYTMRFIEDRENEGLWESRRYEIHAVAIETVEAAEAAGVTRPSELYVLKQRLAYRQQVRVHMHAIAHAAADCNSCSGGCSDCSDRTNDKNENGMMQLSLGIAEFMTKHRM
jgi:hypothetical protein